MKHHILIVEDETDIRDNLRDFFEMEGYRATTAPHGAAALEFLESAGNSTDKPDMILLDLMMPVMSGFEFVQQYRKSHLAYSVPIVVMSADNQTERKTREMGVDHYIKKPLELDSLVQLVERAALKERAL